MITHFLPGVVKILFKSPLACSAVIAAAGASQRMGGDDKLFAGLLGMPALAHALAAFQGCAYVSEIIVVTRLDLLEDVTKLCGDYSISKAVKVITGGGTRLESVLNGVMAASKKARLIAIHDGARPCIDSGIIKNTIEAAAKHHAAAPGIPVAPSLKRVKNGVIADTVDRKDLYEIQTPQVFNASIIKGALSDAFRKSQDITDDCMAAELIGVPVYVTGGSSQNIKLTTAEDVAVAEAILRRRAEGKPCG